MPTRYPTWQDIAGHYERLLIRALERLRAVQTVVARMHDEAGHPGDSEVCELPWCRDLRQALDS